MSERKVVRKKKRWGKVFEYTPRIGEAVLTADQAKEIEADLKKGNSFTPETLAIKHSIKVGLAKEILNKKVANGDLKLVYSSSKNKIYSR